MIALTARPDSPGFARLCSPARNSTSRGRHPATTIGASANAPRNAREHWVTAESADNWPGGVHRLHPALRTGCNQDSNGVQPAHTRGATAAPEPSKEPAWEPAAPPPATEALPVAGAAGGDGGPAGEFFAALGPSWRLTAAQRARLVPAVTTALTAGWTPQTLAAIAGANTSGVRNPYAVLAARLSPAELPLPQSQRPSRPPWCGQCDERTRMLGFDSDAPCPCPRCKGATGEQPCR
jgi:hypothetical protein